jgi:hypothetical protein
MPENRPCPIWVLGTARGGTKLMGNTLASHPLIAGVEHTAHWGIKENSLYHHYLEAGDLKQDDAFIKFVELFAASDFGRLAGVNTSELYRIRPDNFFSLFFEVMDAYTLSKNKRYWVTKFDPFLLEHPKVLSIFLSKMEDRYSRAYFINIRRTFSRVLKSYLRMEGDQSVHQLSKVARVAALILETARYALQSQENRQLCLERGGIEIDFDTVVKQRATAIDLVCKYLSIPHSKEMLGDRFPANSSFIGTNQQYNENQFKYWIAEYPLLRLFITLPILSRFVLLLNDWRRGKVSPFSWRLCKIEQMPLRFYDELDRTGQQRLKQLLFSSGRPEGGSPL